MPREEPFFRKCCFCIPLKTCLQVWSCIKAMADLAIATFLILMVIILASYGELDTDHFTLAHAFIVFILVLVIDSAFRVVLTVGLCTKNLRTLRVFYFYSFYMAIVGSAFAIGFIVFCSLQVWVTLDDVMYPIIVVLLLINTALDVCMIFTLKSEMIKLRNKQQYEFVTLDKEEGELVQPEPFQSDEDNVA